MKTRLKPRRGVAMLAVLTALLLLSILASGFFLQARDAGTMNDIAMAQSIAVTNAEMGIQEAIRRVRSSQIDRNLVGTCSVAQIDSNTCPASPAGAWSSGITSGSNTNPLTGGGLLYDFIVFRRTEPDLVSATPGMTRYVVRATGYYGTTLTSASLVTSVLEAEVDMGSGNNTTCTGSYECI